MKRSAWSGSALLLALVMVAPGLEAQRTRDRDRSRENADADWQAQCDRPQRRYDNYRSCDVRVSTFDPRGRTLSIEPGMNGGARVVGWDRDEVEVHARIQGQGRSMRDADDAAREVRISASNGQIRAETPDGDRDRSASVQFVVYAPRKSNLEVTTHNGPIGVEDVVGRMSLSAQNGPITLSAVGGDVRARAQNGPLTVELDGSRWEGAGLDAETVNGPVHVMVPRDYNAELETGTVNGPAYVDFPLTVNIQGRMSRRFHATLGRGGAPVRAVTTNGPLTLDRPR
jgi:DUF4097 and DUF4098 domain-containing protein YvlB